MYACKPAPACRCLTDMWLALSLPCVQWVFYLFSAMAVLWLPLWLPIRTKDCESLQAFDQPITATSLFTHAIASCTCTFHPRL